MSLFRSASLFVISFFVPLFLWAQSSTEFVIPARYGENTNPPTIPADVTATPISPFQIDVAWLPSTDPFGVAGYQVFRDDAQVATTSLTSFSDTGLAASTTYTYTIRAFDIDGLISSSSVPVATTTFELPPLPPPEPVATTTRPQMSGTFITLMMQYFNLEVGSEAARFEFGVNNPVAYRIQYGINDALAAGIVQTQVLRREHTTVLTDLQPNTTYVYELYVTDRFGREVLLRRGTFTTEPLFVITMPSNVASFSAQVIGDDVFLRWTPNPQEPYAYVRIVRSSRFFPNDPLDGTVVYQGVETTFIDVRAMSGTERQYYTLFAYDLSGAPSSGMPSVAARTVVPPSQPSPPLSPRDGDDVLETETISPPELPVFFTLSDVGVIQHDRQQILSESVVITTNDTFVVRVPTSLIPSQTRTMMVTFWKPEDNWTTSYLMQRDETDSYYKAVLPGFLRAGTYDMRVELYDGRQERFFYVTGLIAAEDRVLPTDQSRELNVSLFTLYIILGGLGGIVAALAVYRFFLFLFARRRSGDDKHAR